MAEALCVCLEVAVLRAAHADAGDVAIISCDEETGIQVVQQYGTRPATKPRIQQTFVRDQAGSG